MIFQDPYASLNPRQTVGSIIAGPMEINGINPPGGREARVRELLETVGLNPEHYNRFPHEFSGGQRQRIGVARAAGPGAEADRRGRAGLRARRVDPGPGRQPAAEGAAGAGHRVPLHRPRPGHRAALLAARRGDVPGQDRGDRRPRLDLQPAPPPVHARADVGRAGRGHRRGEEASGSAWRATSPRRSSRRPAAASAPGAGRRRTSAPRRSRRSSRSPAAARVTSRPATSRRTRRRRTAARTSCSTRPSRPSRASPARTPDRVHASTGHGPTPVTHR